MRVLWEAESTYARTPDCTLRVPEYWASAPHSPVRCIYHATPLRAAAALDAGAQCHRLVQLEKRRDRSKCCSSCPMILLIAAEEHKLFIRGEPGERYTTAASAVAQGSSATRAVVNTGTPRSRRSRHARLRSAIRPTIITFSLLKLI